VFAGGGRSKDIESTGRPFVSTEGYFTEAELDSSLDIFGKLLPHVEHPPPGDNGETTPTAANLEGSPFTSISVESIGGGYNRYEATVEVPAGVREGFTEEDVTEEEVTEEDVIEQDVALLDPKRVRDFNRRNPDLSSGSCVSPAVAGSGDVMENSVDSVNDESWTADLGSGDVIENSVDIVGDVPPESLAMVTGPLENLETGATAPPTASLRSEQTPLRDQGGRGTCVVFCVCAAMEASLKRQGVSSVNLSEQYGQHIFQMTALNDRKPDSDPTNCVGDKRNGPIDTDGFENGLGMVGGGGLSRELPLFTEYGLPDEANAKFQVDPSADRTYVYDGDFAKTNQQGADPQAKWCNPKSATQREVNDFNVEHRVIDVPINTDRTLRMRPFPREALKNADYRIDSYVRINDENDKIQRPEWFEGWIGNRGREVMVSFPMGECTQYDTEKPKRDNYSSDASHRQAVQDWRDDDGDVYTYDGSKDCGPGHCILLVGYKRNANPPHFIAKNSWNTYTKLGYDYVTKGALNEAGVITCMKQSSGALRDQDFMGRWDLTYAGLNGTLDIYRKPGYFDSSDLWGAQDRRVGTFFDSSGRARRVNGRMQASRNRIEFSWGSGNVLDYGDQGGQQATGYMHVSDRDFIAGTYNHRSIKGDSKGFFAVPKGKTTRYPVVQYSTLQPESFLGEWHVRSHAFDGVIDIESTTGGPAHDFTGTMREVGGATAFVSGTANSATEEVRFVFPNRFDGWYFEGYIHAPHSLGNISGRIERVSGGDIQYGPMKLTRIGLADPQLKILEPVEGTKVSGKAVYLKARVTGDPNPGSALVWTVDGPYDPGASDAGTIIAKGTPTRGAVSRGEHTIHATYTLTSPRKTDTVDVEGV